MFLEKLKKMPDSSGVYFFYNKKKVLIYVGKATSLKDRVKSYFRTTPHSLFNKEGGARPIEEMLHEVADIKWEKTGSALEAAILEGKYIKKIRPRYNVKWRDDKSWNYLVFTKDVFPRLVSVRERELSPVPLTKGDRRGVAVLGGRQTTPKPLLGKEGRLSGNYKYIFGPYPGLNMREATKILRRIFHFSDCRPPAPPPAPSSIRRGSHPKPCFYRQLGQCVGVCEGIITPAEYRRKVVRPMAEFLRGGKTRLLKNLAKEMSVASKNKNYEEAARVRDQISALKKIQDAALINESFVSNVIPARFAIATARRAKAGIHGGRLDSRFHGNDNLRIEGYDISNLGSTGKVGSMVVFDEEGPVKSEYRKFNIKTVTGQSDVDCLREVLRRRLKHAEWSLPDLFLIDGGLPQVNAVRGVLKESGVVRPIIGIAKGPRRKNNKFIIFADNTDVKKDIKILDIKDIASWVKDNKKLLIRVRDEAHRFAIAFHRKKRVIR